MMRFSSKKSLQKFLNILERNDIFEKKDLKLYLDLSTNQKNENDNFYEENGKNVYDVIGELQQYGLYDGGEWQKEHPF